MKQPTIYDILEMLESKLEDRIEAQEQSDPEPDTESESESDNLSAHEAIDHIIEGALNLFIEKGAFPNIEQIEILQELRKLQMSYES